jgi:hypothetical protein
MQHTEQMEQRGTCGSKRDAALLLLSQGNVGWFLVQPNAEPFQLILDDFLVRHGPVNHTRIKLQNPT